MNNESKRVISALKQTWHRVDILYNSYAKSVGLNFTTLMVLELVCDSDENLTQKDICEKLDLPKQLVNTIITSLWKQGYVKLKEATNRRNKNIFVTDEGKEYIASVCEPLEDVELAAWEGFSAEEIIIYADIMERYANAFENVLRESNPTR